MGRKACELWGRSLSRPPPPPYTLNPPADLRHCLPRVSTLIFILKALTSVSVQDTDCIHVVLEGKNVIKGGTSDMECTTRVRYLWSRKLPWWHQPFPAAFLGKRPVLPHLSQNATSVTISLKTTDICF